ncbi:hypothetical protein P691DRAFT_658565 [Macrolepiota fuliginosa MF-IS2]|uniref:Sodium/calcium exchanger membrane region domain-containing protein n=1 Tax=Macrolepiota fuliginosa MF-IS2 TaxID=1400762 RepID=A0A9P6C9S1_9AGAR|nr:hypothetical protein P691DRAFT_658565 [Macrolepiota fuliginosa MF-IS2]
MLVFIPISWILQWALPPENPSKNILVFVSSFFAIIPLAKLLGFATEELAQRVGSTLAGLLNATLGNAYVLIIVIIALAKCELRIVQSSMVGSIISNLLLVLGMYFFVGGFKYPEQGFGIGISQLNSSLLTLSVIAVLLPAAFQYSADTSTQQDSPTEARGILAASHGVMHHVNTLIVLLFFVVYMGYLLFQLWSSRRLYWDDYSDVQQSVYVTYWGSDFTGKCLRPSCLYTNDKHKHDIQNSEAAPEQDGEEPQLSIHVAIFLLAVITILVAFTAEWLVDSIDGLAHHGYISPKYIGIVLLPIVGNAAEHVTAVTVSFKDKLNLSLGLAVGSCLVSLFLGIIFWLVIDPGWMIGKHITLLFDPYAPIAILSSGIDPSFANVGWGTQPFFQAFIFLSHSTQDRESDWLGVFLSKRKYSATDIPHHDPYVNSLSTPYYGVDIPGPRHELQPEGANFRPESCNCQASFHPRKNRLQTNPKPNPHVLNRTLRRTLDKRKNKSYPETLAQEQTT